MTIRFGGLYKAVVCVGSALLAAFSAQPAGAGEVWFSPSATFSEDYIDLFKPEAPWERAAAHTAAFEISNRFETAASDDELREVFVDLATRHIALVAGLLPLSPGLDGCGHGVEGYSAAGTPFTVARRIQALGGAVAYFDMDEPLYFGHFYTGKNACQSSLVDLAGDIATKIKRIRSIDPRARFGETEAMSALTLPGGLAEFEQWLDAYQRATGELPAFLRLDMNWSGPWRQTVPLLVDVLRRRGIPIQVIYNGSARDTSNEAWVAEAMRHARELEADEPLVPDVAVIASWTPHPDRVLPETQPGTMTNFINQYFEWSACRTQVPRCPKQ